MSDSTDATLAVIAHGLLSSLAVVAGGVETLQANWHRLPDEKRDELFAMVREQTSVLEGVLRDLIAGLPADVREMMAELGELLDRPQP